VQVPLPAHDACLFLDVDGTLLDFAMTPDGVCVDEDLIELLRGTARVTQGAFALISGRSIAEIDRLFAPLRLPVAGVHGYERRDAGGTVHRQSVLDERLPSARLALEEFAGSHVGLLLEDKQSALALHYRRVPHLEESARVIVARLLISLLPEYELLEGDAVLEIKPVAHNKATAIEAFLRESPFAGRVPVFLGDDLTDYDGFVAVRKHGGVAIAVGDRMSAQWHLADPAAARAWLRAYVQQSGAPS
jgi:trehalose 6-phosphate phosphatase